MGCDIAYIPPLPNTETITSVIVLLLSLITGRSVISPLRGSRIKAGVFAISQAVFTQKKIVGQALLWPTQHTYILREYSSKNVL